MPDRIIEFTVPKGVKSGRADKIFSAEFDDISRVRLQKAFDAELVTFDGAVIDKRFKVNRPGVLRAVLEEVVLGEGPKPINIPLNIIYEDESIVVVNKPSGMVVHPGHGNYTGTMLNALLYHFESLPKNINNRPGLVHRIDKDTSGLLVVAKTEEAMTHLAKQFFDKTSERTYLALVWGDVLDDKGTVEGHIGRDPKNRLLMTVFPDGSQGKEAITHFEVVERFGYNTLLRCQLETGRTHQIRAHLKHLGHTLFNDARYGGDKILKGTTFTKYKQFVDNCFKVLPRQALHAQTLGFVHPTTAEKMSFEAKLPQDMQTAIEKWRHYAKHRLD